MGSSTEAASSRGIRQRVPQLTDKPEYQLPETARDTRKVKFTAEKCPSEPTSSKDFQSEHLTMDSEMLRGLPAAQAPSRSIPEAVCRNRFSFLLGFPSSIRGQGAQASSTSETEFSLAHPLREQTCSSDPIYHKENSEMQSLARGNPARQSLCRELHVSPR